MNSFSHPAGAAGHSASPGAHVVHAGHSAHDTAGLAGLLDLDAAILGSYLSDATAWASALAPQSPRTIVDLGAGTGAGTLALAERFPTAAVIALDRSTGMLGRIEAEASRRGSADRVRTVEADVDVAWPVPWPVDVVWAASSLHEVRDAERVIRDVHAALAPGGLFAVLEFAAPPFFAFADASLGSPGWEGRVHRAATDARGDSHPDWSAPLGAAGFDVIDRRAFRAEVGPGTPDAGRYARTYLERVRPALDAALDDRDRAALDAVLADGAADSPLGSDALTIRTERTSWAARRP